MFCERPAGHLLHTHPDALVPTGFAQPILGHACLPEEANPAPDTQETT